MREGGGISKGTAAPSLKSEGAKDGASTESVKQGEAEPREREGKALNREELPGSYTDGTKGLQERER